MRKLLIKLGEWLVKKYSDKKLYDPSESLREVMEEDLLLVTKPKAFADLNIAQQDLVRYRCYELSEDDVLKFIIDSLTYEQSMSTIRDAKNMEEIKAGRYANYGVIGLKRLIDSYAVKPKDEKSYNKYRLFSNS